MKDAPLPESTKATTFQLMDGTVSPVRIIGSDEDGLAVEETISCYPDRELFVDAHGNICDVIYSNSRTSERGMAVEQYKRLKREEWLRAGGLPLGECPHMPSGEYLKMLGRRVLAAIPAPKKGDKNPEVIEPCEGEPKGCKHLHKIRDARMAKQRARVDADNSRGDSIPLADVEKMQRAFGAGFADAARGATPDQKRLQGEGEKDAK